MPIKYLTSVTPVPKNVSKSPSRLVKLETLQFELRKKGLNIQLKDSLKGGFTSQVYSADLDGKSVVVKHTEHLIPFDPTEVFLSKDQNNVDAHVLKLLQNSKNVKVPKVINHFNDLTTTIMENLYSKAYFLLQELILKNNLPLNTASNIGRQLADLVIESKRWKPFNTSVSAQESIYERGLELRLTYPNSQSEFLKLQTEYLTRNKNWMWPDGHPKNMFINKNGEVIFFDFGFSHWADSRFMLPNFLAHIVIYSLAGYLNRKISADYIFTCFKAYEKIEPINEYLFCQYLAMEVLHRSHGKWVDGIKTVEQKLALIKFGLSVFDKKINTVKKLLTFI